MAGRDLDFAVGRELFGYQMYHYTKGPNEYYCLVDADFNPVLIETPGGDWTAYHDCERKTKAEAWDDCPKFSDTSHMDFCFMVLDRLIEREWIPTICLIPHLTAYGSEWRCVLDSAKMPFVKAAGSSFSEAVCRAGLLTTTVHW